MKKSDLKKVIKVIVTELRAVQRERILESNKGLSGMKKASDKKDNTQMGSEDKTITSTTKPTEKKEGKKLPVKDKNTKGNTETDHSVSDKSTPMIKEELIKMIREALTAHVSESQPPTDPAATPPTEPVGAEDGEEVSPEAPAVATGKVNVMLNGKNVGKFSFRLPSGKVDTRPMKAMVNSFVYNNPDLLQYDVDGSVIEKFDELSDEFSDNRLSPNAKVELQVSGNSLRVQRTAAPQPAQAPAPQPPPTPQA